MTSNEHRGFDDSNIVGVDGSDGHNFVIAKTHESETLEAKLYGT